MAITAKDAQDALEAIRIVTDRDAIIDRRQLDLTEKEENQLKLEMRDDRRLHELASDVQSLIRTARRDPIYHRVNRQIYARIREKLKEMTGLIRHKQALEKQELAEEHEKARGTYAVKMRDSVRVANTLKQLFDELEPPE